MSGRDEPRTLRLPLFVSHACWVRESLRGGDCKETKQQEKKAAS